MLQSISRIHGSIRWCRSPRHVTRTTRAFHPKARQWLHANPCPRYNFIRGKKSFEAVRQSWGRARPIRSVPASYNTWCSEWTAGDDTLPPRPSSSCILHKRWRRSYEKHTHVEEMNRNRQFSYYSYYSAVDFPLAHKWTSEVRCCGNRIDRGIRLM